MINGEEIELFEAATTVQELNSNYIEVTGDGDLTAFASATLSGGTDEQGEVNASISKFLDMSRK